MNVMVFLMAGIGILLIYSAIKNQNPIDVVKGAFQK